MITRDGNSGALGTTTKTTRKRSAAGCGAPAAAARRGHAFWDHSATLGIRTCCGWSFGHSRGPVVVPRCARRNPDCVDNLLHGSVLDGAWQHTTPSCINSDSNAESRLAWIGTCDKRTALN